MESTKKVEPAKKDTSDTQARKAKQLPIPKGYKLLIALPEAEEKTKGGIIKAAQTMQVKKLVLFVALL